MSERQARRKLELAGELKKMKVKLDEIEERCDDDANSMFYM